MLSFFTNRSGADEFEHIVAKATAMIGDARHSFDLATLALLTDAGPDAVADDIRSTDAKINLAEQELRSELVVHVSVQGSADIGSVLAFILLLQKLERVGDQAKNILELAEHGVSLTTSPAVERLLEERQVVSELFGEAAILLGDADVNADAIESFANRVDAMSADLRGRIDACMTSQGLAADVVPHAFYARYLLRIVANLLGAVRSSAEPIARFDADGSVVDVTDD